MDMNGLFRGSDDFAGFIRELAWPGRHAVVQIMMERAPSIAIGALRHLGPDEHLWGMDAAVMVLPDCIIPLPDRHRTRRQLSLPEAFARSVRPRLG
jgi:hypothetical protein